MTEDELEEWVEIHCAGCVWRCVGCRMSTSEIKECIKEREVSK